MIGIGGDHCLSWSYLRAARDKVGGPVALVHLDAHLDTGDEYHGNKLRFFNNFLEQNDINWSLSGLTLGSMERNFDLFISLRKGFFLFPQERKYFLERQSIILFLMNF